MTAQRIPLAEMTAVAHAQGLEVELDNAAGRMSPPCRRSPRLPAASAADGAS